jgi:hypothetical protein
VVLLICNFSESVQSDLASDDHESNKQGLGDAAVFSIGQRDSPKPTYDSVYREHPKS